MAKDHNNIWKEFFKYARSVSKDIRYAKGLIIVGVVVAFILGAQHGFPKADTSMPWIVFYVFSGILIFPALLIFFAKFDERRAMTTWS